MRQKKILDHIKYYRVSDLKIVHRKKKNIGTQILCAHKYDDKMTSDRAAIWKQQQTINDKLNRTGVPVSTSLIS